MLNKRKIMKLLNLMLVLLLVALSLASAIPKPDEEEHKNRVFDKELSDKQHYEDDDDHDHNSEYDHEAFLGREDAKTFDQLSAEESKDRLGKIYDKIDKDGNGKVTEEELKDWIKHVQNKYVNDDTERQWKEHDAEEDNTLTWESYKKRTYGYLNDDDANDEDEEDSYNYKDMIRRDERRWQKADKDGDNRLTKEEFTDFLHPEDAENMRDIVIDETLEDIDKDKDGFISIEEYIGDMYPEPEIDGEPEWVSSEREQFVQHRDKNKDGKMDRDEIKDWIMPEDWDHVQVETTHLIHEADTDQDGELSKEEVLDKYDLFVGSQATDFGEALTRHDEF